MVRGSQPGSEGLRQGQGLLVMVRGSRLGVTFMVRGSQVGSGDPGWSQRVLAGLRGSQAGSGAPGCGQRVPARAHIHGRGGPAGTRGFWSRAGFPAGVRGHPQPHSRGDHLRRQLRLRPRHGSAEGAALADPVGLESAGGGQGEGQRVSPNPPCSPPPPTPCSHFQQQLPPLELGALPLGQLLSLPALHPPQALLHPVLHRRHLRGTGGHRVASPSGHQGGQDPGGQGTGPEGRDSPNRDPP